MVEWKSDKEDCFRGQNKVKVEIDPTLEFRFVPSLDKEFAYLLGLEEVVHFRLEWLDKLQYNVPKKQKGKGKKKNKNSPTSTGLTTAIKPCPPTKDSLICAQCSADVSCSWKKNTKGLLLCESCFKGSWRKDHWWTTRPEECAISPASGNLNSHIPSSSSQPVRNNSKINQEAAFPSASSNSQESDQKVIRMWSFHPLSSDSTSSSPLSSPTVSSDLSSSPSSSPSSNPLFFPGYYSPTLNASSCSNGSSSSYYPTSSNLNSSFSSSSPSPHVLQNAKE